MTGVFVGVALLAAAITAAAWGIRRTVEHQHEQWIDDGTRRLEAMANHPAGRSDA